MSRCFTTLLTQHNTDNKEYALGLVEPKGWKYWESKGLTEWIIANRHDYTFLNHCEPIGFSCLLMPQQNL